MNEEQQQVWDALSKPEPPRRLRTIKPGWTVSILSNTSTGIHPYYQPYLTKVEHYMNDEQKKVWEILKTPPPKPSTPWDDIDAEKIAEMVRKRIEFSQNREKDEVRRLRNSSQNSR